MSYSYVTINNNPAVINGAGYMGLWQMGEAALIDAGFIVRDANGVKGVVTNIF